MVRERKRSALCDVKRDPSPLGPIRLDRVPASIRARVGGSPRALDAMASELRQRNRGTNSSWMATYNHRNVRTVRTQRRARRIFRATIQEFMTPENDNAPTPLSRR